jgi:GNAT superfamily N-acetyltransferase
VEIRQLAEKDRPWALEIETESWGTPVVARLGELVDPTVLPGFVACLDGQRVGLVTYAVRGDACEIVTIRSLREGVGVGRALLQAVREAALAVYQRWGLDLVALHVHAVDDARRRLKPSIAERDANGIPIAHELELELRLD